ncbi:DUF6708 domain-containing protein [Janthinobacterium sp. B9-8]|uniref:DUF6708 domain-containing protein n=1 Tax=Janthinobacterium sp. B9-8 TaxID=1236179 RepID=UPI00061D290D|nr:DUF6708 domain-containing protein [Janthinobacterium sp. B9-8]AMC35413.1 hypothetical protein VN23_12715 [Janthinobacterium sp. B9-8]
MTPTASTTAYRLLKGEYPSAIIDVSSIDIAAYLSKETTARCKGSSLNGVKTIYPEAIELASTTHYQRGLVTLFSLLVFFGGLPLMSYALYVCFFELEIEGLFTFLFKFVFMTLSGLGVFYALHIGLYQLRADMFSLKNDSLIFDKKKQKVYRVFRDTPGLIDYIRKSFKKRNPLYAWPTVIIEYDWNSLIFVYVSKVVMLGQLPSTVHSLGVGIKDPDFAQKQVAKSDHDKAWDQMLKHEAMPDFVDFFTIGNPLVMSEHSVRASWAYLHAYMEENGPALPVGETLAEAAPNSWWQSMGCIGPYGPKIKKWNQDHPIFVVISFLFFPIFGPLYLLWGTFNWLSHKTAFEAPFPPEIRAEWGEPLLPKK